MKKNDSNSEVNEAQIASHWKEEEVIQPSSEFVNQANISNPNIFQRFNQNNFPEFYQEYANLLDWDEPWHTTLDTYNPPFWNCLLYTSPSPRDRG